MFAPRKGEGKGTRQVSFAEDVSLMTTGVVGGGNPESAYRANEGPIDPNEIPREENHDEYSEKMSDFEWVAMWAEESTLLCREVSSIC